MIAKDRGPRISMVVTSVTLEPAQLAWLDAVAARERRSRSFLVRDAIAREINRHEHATEQLNR
jgi:predicted transcriptional regulator